MRIILIIISANLVVFWCYPIVASIVNTGLAFSKIRIDLIKFSLIIISHILSNYIAQIVRLSQNFGLIDK